MGLGGAAGCVEEVELVKVLVRRKSGPSAILGDFWFLFLFFSALPPTLIAVIPRPHSDFSELTERQKAQVKKQNHRARLHNNYDLRAVREDPLWACGGRAGRRSALPKREGDVL